MFGLRKKKNREEKENTENEDIQLEANKEQQETSTHQPIIEDEAEKEQESLILYIVTDRKTKGLVNYFRECGLNVSNIISSISQARDTLLMQYKPCRFVIIDTGTGKFTSTKVRQELIDVLGICDESNKVSVFYTDSIIKAEATRILGKNKLDMDWYKYQNTVTTVATLLSCNEKYELDEDSENDEELTNTKLINMIKGTDTKVECDKSLKESKIKPADIRVHIEEESGLIETYEVTY